ncbi:hypothetical protein CDAR_386961 [Caerostris darwini]|uniref:Uncharacterized protein n=1 Tax=Caerostris darwini TaxID=1538125 RepID=A0AAV4WNM9_9ARAC|nr:hypothetical protein CDAR_386961 [Caerostris darwini]
MKSKYWSFPPVDVPQFPPQVIIRRFTISRYESTSDFIYPKEMSGERRRRKKGSPHKPQDKVSDAEQVNLCLHPLLGGSDFVGIIPAGIRGSGAGAISLTLVA